MTTFVSTSFSWGSDGAAMTDAVFRSRMSHIHSVITGCGMVQTADTGQIDFATVTMGSQNTDRGYAIYYLNDSRHAVDPLYIKVFYGVGTATARTRLRIQTGTGSNGAGTLTGQLSTALTVGDGYSLAGTTQTVQSYSCMVDGYFFFAIGIGNTGHGTAYHYYALSRSRDNTYAFDSLGNLAYGCAGNGSPLGEVQFTRTGGSNFTGAYNGHFCVIPGSVTDSALLNGDKQLYPHWYADPAVKQAWSHFTLITNEAPSGITTFSATPIVAGGARTFIWLGGQSPYGEAYHVNGTYRSAFLWE